MEIPITQVDDSISNMELERAPLLKSQEGMCGIDSWEFYYIKLICTNLYALFSHVKKP